MSAPNGTGVGVVAGKNRDKSRKIIVGCDGTWLNSDNGSNVDQTWWPMASSRVRPELITPSNVTRLCRALGPTLQDQEAGAQEVWSESERQVVDYEPGIGSAANPWDHYVNGATAMSIGENVRQAYMAVAEKHAYGDEIYLLGFSRGAFIARSVASMINAAGLLTKRGMEHFYDIFQDWEHQNLPGYPRNNLMPGYSGVSFQFPDNTPAEQVQHSSSGTEQVQHSPYAGKLQDDGFTRLNIQIKCVAVFETVGSLGVPITCLQNPRYYAFVNTAVLPNVDHCFQALALDEARRPFSPTLWEIPEARKGSCDLRQCWFPGVHSNIGGSVNDAEIPDITLAWMVTQLQSIGLQFDEDYLDFVHSLNVQYYRTPRRNEPQHDNSDPPNWSMGYITNKTLWIEKLAGTQARTPGRYHRTNPETGAREPQRLQNTNETVHPSARIRTTLGGPGINDRGQYHSGALKGYQLINKENPAADPADPYSTGWVWRYQGVDDSKSVELTEEVMTGTELRLLKVEGVRKPRA